ncbi:MAG: spore coat protein CotH [Lachnospiraceae bacterium]|nr:spore coat protein CotH [Lachnospiraceae bacterium]
MKKTSYFLLLILIGILLSGCGNGATETPDPPANEPTTAGSNVPGAEAQDTPVTPAPTEVPSGPHVAFSADSGFYDKKFDLELTCSEEGAVIYYTTDGSVPDKTSTPYTDPFTITDKKRSANVLSAITGLCTDSNYVPPAPVAKGTVIRAVAYLADGTKTPVANASYFVGINRQKSYGDVPIISLITNADNFFDYETGIYVLGKTYDDWLKEDPSRAYLESWQAVGNFSMRGKEWEREISVEYLSADGSAGFIQDMGVRIMGGASRGGTQKSLKLIAREEYGKKNLKFDLLPGNIRSDETGPVTKYKSFVLRIGGNDANFGRLRDPFLQNLVAECHFETQSSTPCVVFLNGEYWGMYDITEDYSDNYFENNYGIDNNNIVLLKRGEIEDGEEDDLRLFHEMYFCITGQDMSVDRHYKEACELLDMDSFAEYCAFELYVINQDSMFDNNNWRMWRVRNADHATAWSDGKWRMAAYDTDYSSGIYSGGSNYKEDNITGRLTSSKKEREENIKHYAPIELFRSLMQNKEFRTKFLLALCDMRNIYFKPDTATTLLDEMAPDYIRLMPDTFARFGPDWIAWQNTSDYIKGRIEEVRTFITGRYTNFPSLMRKIFGLGTIKRLTIKTSDYTLGTVKLNNGTLNLEKDFTSMYFPELTVTLTAIPAEGAKFTGWETDSSYVTDKTAATITIPMTEAATVKATFAPK